MNHIFYIVGYMWVVCGSYVGYMWVILENDSLLVRIYQAVNWGLISGLSRSTAILGLTRF